MSGQRVQVDRSRGWRAADRRTFTALESIAASLERLSLPLIPVEGPETPRESSQGTGRGKTDPEAAQSSPDAVVWVPRWTPPTPEVALERPEAPRNENASQSTPEQKRDAWVAIVRELETMLIRTREAAKASRSTAWVIRQETGHVSSPGEDDYDATAWACMKLLTLLGTAPAPEVPEDHARGQATIMDALADAMAKPLDAEVFIGQSSTPVEKPVEGDR